MGKLLQPDSRAVAEYNLKPGDMVYVTAGVRGPPPLDATGAVLARYFFLFSFFHFLCSLILYLAVVDRCCGVTLQRSRTTPPISKANLWTRSRTNSNKCPWQRTTNPKNHLPYLSDRRRLRDNRLVLPVVLLAAKFLARMSPSYGNCFFFLSPLSLMDDIDCNHSASTIQHFAKVTTVLRPHSEAVFDESNSRWPRQSQAYCVYTRKGANGEITGIITFGLSNPYQNTFYYAIGIGIEIMLEAPTTQSRLSGPDGAVTGATISESWMFAVVHEMAHQCFALGLQIRQLLEKVTQCHVFTLFT